MGEEIQASLVESEIIDGSLKPPSNALSAFSGPPTLFPVKRVAKAESHSRRIMWRNESDRSEKFGRKCRTHASRFAKFRRDGMAETSRKIGPSQISISAACRMAADPATPRVHLVRPPLTLGIVIAPRPALDKLPLASVRTEPRAMALRTTRMRPNVHQHSSVLVAAAVAEQIPNWRYHTPVPC